MSENQILTNHNSFTEAVANNCMHHLFERMVEEDPHAVALVFENKILTFRELNDKSNKLANYLVKNHHIKPDDLIGIRLDRSERMIIGILAILKAGGGYVPIDPDSSIERFNLICSDASLKVVLCDKPFSNSNLKNEITFIDLFDENCYSGNGDNLNILLSGNSTAYVIYTSGSTGTPKGGKIGHDSLYNFIIHFLKPDKLTPNDRFLQISNYLFDVSIMELLVPLCYGSRIIILEKGVQAYPEKIIKAVEDNKITMLFFTPAMLQLFLDFLISFKYDVKKLKSLKKVVVGGEALTVKLANLFNNLIYKANGTRLTNIYGPSEATVWVTTWDCESKEELQIVPIGKPVENTDIYILDDNNKMLPNGEAGEIVIGGIPVGKGYLNRPELNEEKFVPNPFRPGEKMYKTGDKGRYLPDGNIEFLGRVDNLIKLNGNRIELGEIENCILNFDQVKECIVLMHNINGSNELVAYFTTTSENVDENLLIDEIVAGLNNILPGYMIPDFYMKLDSFLINPNGKVDRKSFPLPTKRYYKHISKYVAPSTDTEKKLTAIIEKILNAEKISIDDIIFNIGVKSLLVTKIIIEINAILNTTISVSQFFHFPSIRGLAFLIDREIVPDTNAFTLLKEGTGTPLFLLPGYKGDQLNFFAFAADYKVDQPLYSIDFLYEEEHKSFVYDELYLSKMASYLISQIKQIQPQGPYNLLGYSSGGIIAFEIAAQLQKAGNKVGLLGTIGSTPPFKSKGLLRKLMLIRELNFLLSPDFYTVQKYFTIRFPHIIKVTTSKLINHFKKSGIKNIVVKSANESDENQNFVLSNNTVFNMSYQTQLTYKGDIILIYEDLLNINFNSYKIEDFYLFKSLPQIWKKFVKGKIITHKIDCNHQELVIEPYANMIAVIIADYFDKNPEFK